MESSESSKARMARRCQAANYALQAYKLFVDRSDRNPLTESTVVDLIADLAHWANNKDIDVEGVFSIALLHYTEERYEDE